MTSQPKLNQRQSRCCPLPENDGGGSDDHDEHCLEKWCKMVAITSLEAGSETETRYGGIFIVQITSGGKHYLA